jgi:hypothetical protein
MPVKISKKAVEGSTFTVVVEFNEVATDGTKTPIVPNSDLTWTLSDGRGAVINSRNNVPIDPPLQSVMIVLFGDDLKTFPGKTTRRFITIKGTYNGVAGNNLPLIDEGSFQIDNLVGV